MANFKNRILEYGVKPADQFLAHPKNARMHPQFQRQAMKAALDTVGFVAPVLEAKSGYLVDGHERIWQALQNDNADVPYVRLDISEEEEAYVLATFDPLTALANYDAELLDGLLREVNTDSPAIQQMLSDLAESNGLYMDTPAVGDDPGAQVDRAEELLAKWPVKRGDLWLIGEHRLLCGDSTNADDVARLMGDSLADCMWTDPPYGVEYVGKTADALTIQNDGAANLPELLANAFSCADDILRAGASIYVAHPPGALCVTFGNAFIKAGWHFHETLIWVKNSMVLGHSDYHFKHEPLIYGWKEGDHNWYGGRDKVSVFEVDKPQRNGEHPTMKPLELIVTQLQNSTARNNTVYDPFLGSGTTLVACEQTGRKGRGIEIEPKYCAVILERMAGMGLEPRLSE